MLVQGNERSTGNTISQTPFVEMERLSNQVLLMKHVLGGLLPGITPTDIVHVHDVLEIGCGPGSWSLEMAYAYYSQMTLIGVDTDPLMIAHANHQVRDRQLHNIRYIQVQDLAGPFALADHSFDLISAQFLSRVLYKDSWLYLLDECWRLLRPNGWLRLTDLEAAESNAPAHEDLWGLFIQAMHRSGRSFSPSDRHLGILCELEPCLSRAGFRDTRCISQIVNYSSGAPLHEEWKRDFIGLANWLHKLIVQAGVSTPEYFELLWRRQEREMDSWNFRAVLPLLTVWGRK